MADIGSLMTIIQNVPSQIEQAHRSLSSFSVNAIEQWHLRFQNIINLLTVLQEQIQHEGENIFPELSTLCDEALLVYTETENIRFGSRQVAAGQQSRLIVSEDNCNDHDQAFNSFGRPRKEILKEDIEREFATFRCWKVVARLLGVSAKTLRRRRIEYDMLVSPVTGPRISYSNITHKELCDVLRTILDTLPDVGETILTGALRARGIYVQRRRIRDAIMEIDPVNRALRRTISVVRRIYSVSSTNALWYVLRSQKY